MKADSDRPVARITPRSAATRAKLLSVAERLFAEKGFEAVSINEIGRAAHQRYSNSCQYHFGDKQGLIQAILDKHLPTIASQRSAMFDALEVSGRDSELGAVVHAWVKPVAEKSLDPNGGAAFIRITAQLIVTHLMGDIDKRSEILHVPEKDRLSRKLKAVLSKHGVPEPVQRQRIMIAAVMLFQGLADHMRFLEELGMLRPEEILLFSADLEAMIASALIAPAAG